MSIPLVTKDKVLAVHLTIAWMRLVVASQSATVSIDCWDDAYRANEAHLVDDESDVYILSVRGGNILHYLRAYHKGDQEI